MVTATGIKAPKKPMAKPSYVGVKDLTTAIMERSVDHDFIPFGAACPQHSLFPSRKLARLLGSVARRDPTLISRESMNWGYEPLTREISRRYLSFLRKQPGEFSGVGVNQMLTDLDHLMRVHPSQQNNEFDIQPLAQDISVKLNGTDVIQMLLNLAVNAFQASPHPHRVQVSGESLTEPLDLSAFKDAPGERLLNVENFQNVAPLVRLTVSDNGPGIPPEVLPKIFQAYFTTKDVRMGTGLGLNIVQRLVKESGGALHVKTAPGEGTAFSVYLPGAPIKP